MAKRLNNNHVFVLIPIAIINKLIFVMFNIIT